jgi:hypothetical protein
MPSDNLREANQSLKDFSNLSIEMFYEAYAEYLGRDFTDLKRNINYDNPNIRL